MGVNECYHALLRAVYTKVLEDNFQLDKTHALSLAVRAVNDTAGPHGLVCTLLVFGSVPRLPVRIQELPGQDSQIKSMITARKEMARLAAQLRLECTLRQNVPKASKSDVRIGDLVLMYHEKPIGK